MGAFFGRPSLTFHIVPITKYKTADVMHQLERKGGGGTETELIDVMDYYCTSIMNFLK